MRYFLNRWNSFTIRKKITVDISSPARPRDPNFAKFLHVFRLLRCRDFKFAHPQRVHPALNLVEQEIVGASVVINLLPAYRDISRMGRILRAPLQAGTSNQRQATVQQWMDAMWEATETFDIRRFQREAQPLLALFNSEMAMVANAAQARAVEIEERIQNEEQRE